LQSISGVSAINPLVAFYDIHGGKRVVLYHPGHYTGIMVKKNHLEVNCVIKLNVTETVILFTFLFIIKITVFFIY
jgi:hypothetical protein